MLKNSDNNRLSFYRKIFFLDNFFYSNFTPQLVCVRKPRESIWIFTIVFLLNHNQIIGLPTSFSIIIFHYFVNVYRIRFKVLNTSNFCLIDVKSFSPNIWILNYATNYFAISVIVLQ